MKLGSIAATIAFAVALGGCAAQGPPFERAGAPPGRAVIYVYRPYSFFSSAIHPIVQCGSQSAAIEPGAYHAFVVPAGPTGCRAGTETRDEVEIDAEPRVHYLRERISWGWLIGRPHLDPMDHDEAEAEIRSCCVQQQ